MKIRLVPSFKRRLAVLAIAVTLIAGVISTRTIIGRIEERRKRQAFDNLTSSSIERIAELSVLEYRYTDVMELSRPFFVGAGSFSLARFSGIVKAGVRDVSRISVEYHQDEDAVSIVMPRSEILENIVDVESLRFWDVRKNLFVPISTENKLKEIGAFKERVANELRDSGFLADADARSSEIVHALYSSIVPTVRVSWETDE